MFPFRQSINVGNDAENRMYDIYKNSENVSNVRHETIL